MLQYSPTHQLFPGDEKMKASMVQTKRKRRRVTGELECIENVTYSMFYVAQNKPSTRSVSERLCGDLIDFERHVEYWAQRKNPRPCEAYGADYYNICGLCNFPLHFFPQIGWHIKKTCLLKYHSEAFFELEQSDSTFLEKYKGMEGTKQTNFGTECSIC